MRQAHRLLAPSEFQSVIRKATQARGGLVPAIMVGSAHCPWCELILKEQLSPRMVSQQRPQLLVLDFDLADRKPVEGLRLNSPASTRLLSPADWAKGHRYALAPTVVFTNQLGQPITEPLIGYASRDFYGAYLEDRILQAQAYWQKI
jgi:thioredoxin-related protein